MAKRKYPNQDRLKEILKYDCSTGVFKWRVKKSYKVNVGSIAGYTDIKGYRIIGIDNSECFAHILAWIYHYGERPKKIIDHINRDKDDNRISNLRLATNSQNKMNSAISLHNKAGHKGVSPASVKGKWIAQIQIDGGKISLGTFDNKREACIAYCAAALVLQKAFFPGEEAMWGETRRA